MFNKKGSAGIGDFISLFFVTVIIVILVLTILFGNSFIKFLSGQRTGSHSIILISSEEYITSYNSKLSDLDYESYELNKPVINTRYFPHYITEEGSAFELEPFTETYVKESCVGYVDSKLTFITGVTDVVENYNPEAIDGFYLYEAQDACFFVLNYLRGEDSEEKIYEKITSFDIELLQKEKGVLCCYGN